MRKHSAIICARAKSQAAAPGTGHRPHGGPGPWPATSAPFLAHLLELQRETHRRGKKDSISHFHIHYRPQSESFLF